MAKIRRVVRKPPSEHQGDIFEDQLWPTYIALVILAAFSMGVSAAYLKFNDPNPALNAITWLILIPLGTGAFMLAFRLLDNRTLRRSMQFSAVVCAIIHLALVVQMYETGLFTTEIVRAPDARPVERRPPKPLPEYRPQQMMSAQDRPQQDHEKPIETKTPEPEREPEEVVRQETPKDVAPPQPQPIPVPEVVATTEPNIIRKPQPNEAAPKAAETPAKLSRQVKPAETKVSQIIETPKVAQATAKPTEAAASAAAVQRQSTSANAAPREVKEPTTQTESPTASVARRTEQNAPTPETTAQPTLQRQVARPAETPRSQVAAVQTPAATKETTPQELKPANTASTKTASTSPSLVRNQTEPLPEVSTQATPQPQRRQQESAAQPTIAQMQTPVPNRQPRTTERPDVKTQASVVTPATTAGQTSPTEAKLTPQTNSIQRATAQVTAPRPTELPSAEPSSPRADQVASRMTRTAGQSAPTATPNPTQTPSLTRSTNSAPSVPSATRVDTTAAAATQVATSGELSPTSTATQRTAVAAAQQAPATGAPRPTTVAANTTTPSPNATSARRANDSNNPSDAPAVTPGTTQITSSRSTQPVRSNTVTTVADVPANAGPQTASSAALGPSSATVSRQMTANSAGATRTQPTASTTVGSPTAQVSQGGATRAQNSTTPTIDPTGNPGRSPSRAVATAAQATSPTAVDSPAQSIAAQGAGDPAAQPARMALSRSLGGVAGVGKSPNMDRSLPGSTGAAMVASSAARRAEATQSGPTGDALAPSAPAQIARARAGDQAPTASLKAEAVDHATSPGANEVAAVNASSSAALTRADSDARHAEVTGAKGAGEVDLGPTQIVAEAGTGRAAGGGQAELNFETNAPQIARKTDTGGSPVMSLASAKVDEKVAAPMGTSGGQPAASDPGPSAVSPTRTLAGGESPASGGPSKASENGPSAEVNSAAMLAESAVSRRDNAEGASGGAASAGQPEIEDEKEKALRLARQAAGGGPQLAIAGPVVAAVSQSPMGNTGDGGTPNAQPKVTAVIASTGRQNMDGGAPRGGAAIAAGEPGEASRGGAEQVGSVTVTRAEASDGAPGEPALGGGTGSPSRAAKGITLAANTQAETIELAGSPQSGGAPQGQMIEAQGTEAQRLAGGAPGPVGDGPTGAVAGAELVAASTAGSPGEASGRRNASAATGDGPQVGGETNNGAPGRRAATTEIAGGASTVAEIPQMGPTSAIAQAELDHGMGNMGAAPMTRQDAAESVAVNIEAPDGPGGLGAEHAPRVGLNTRQAREDSVQMQVQTARFLRQKAGGLPSVSTSVVMATDPFAKRSARDKGMESAGGKGSPPPQTEQAIEMGLQFLARYQQTDGRWSLQGFGEDTQLASDTAATALSLLAFQGAGFNHREHQYKDVVRSGIDHLLAHQRENGDLFMVLDDNSNRSVWLYSHALATIALCEAYGMTQDPELRVPAQKAIDFIVAAQHKERGGWRYAPGVSSDTSVSGWMMMALKSGELANLTVPKETYTKIDAWLNAAQKSGSDPHEFRYNPFAEDTPEQRHGLVASKTMTSVGLLMRLYSGSKRDQAVMQQGAAYLRKNLPAIGDARNPQRDTYYWYYGTQVMYHMGGEDWKAWNGKLHPLLVNSQIKQGPLAGSWQPRGPVPDRWSSHAGRLYVTTMNLLSLEVYYRHLPLYEDTAK
ncbi:hypothetical protein NA78x_003519 [Anatilimnocola sp. NA78]|uniref:hypothetical protein n=1 Tax=Anatilimnocola sp. NA78 TaxID=3415683 RepID=UPI003CE515D8